MVGGFHDGSHDSATDAAPTAFAAISFGGGAPIIFVVFVVIMIIAGVIGYLREKQRREDLQALAQKLGLRFRASNDSSHDDEYAQFEIFRRGHSRVAKNTMTGTVELFGRACKLVTGDFRYKVTSGSGKNRRTTTYHFSYLIAHTPWDTPPLLVRPEGVWDKLKGAFGFDDIDFESDEFSRKFYVNSSDRKFAYDVLHPQMMEYLLQARPPMIDIEGGALCLSGGRGRWEPDRFEGAIAIVQKFCELWPRHLLKEFDS
ncbi:MAG: DUF3137 domain-containing protein [Planctomycetota bacterium]|nr:DUF3137 domain-containing protein [Planctomycetota bacterium]MEC9048093.1 DUF3137 domain-containing protein [Planctomycetota bacterium]